MEWVRTNISFVSYKSLKTLNLDKIHRFWLCVRLKRAHNLSVLMFLLVLKGSEFIYSMQWYWTWAKQLNILLSPCSDKNNVVTIKKKYKVETVQLFIVVYSLCSDCNVIFSEHVLYEFVNFPYFWCLKMSARNAKLVSHFTFFLVFTFVIGSIIMWVIYGIVLSVHQ